MIRKLIMTAMLAIMLTADAGAADMLSYYLLAGDGEYVAYKRNNLYFHSAFTAEEKAFILFSNVFASERLYCIPENVSLIDVKISGDMLALNVSRDILNYGGTYYEYMLIQQLLINAFSIPGVVSVTLLIEGSLLPLAEGTIVHALTHEWLESQTD